MEYHSDFMFFHLLYLKWQLTGDSTINIPDLENAFYVFQENINRLNNTNQKFDFYDELNRVMMEIPFFEFFDNSISLEDDAEPSDILRQLHDYIEYEASSIDLFMEDALLDDNVFDALKLPIPLDEMKSLFDANSLILRLHQILAKKESENSLTAPIRTIIKLNLESIKRFLEETDDITYAKITVCLAYYNNILLKDSAMPNINASWNIALLSKDKNLLTSLSYDLIFDLKDNVREDKARKSLMEDLKLTLDNYDDDDEEDDEYNDEMSTEIEERSYIIDSKFFFSHFAIYLEDYINSIPNDQIKNELIKRKHLFLITSDALDIEEYYLEHGSLDDLPLPPLKEEWLDEDSFSFLISNFEELLSYIRQKDCDVTSDNTPTSIISILLLKCYLDLSINETIKKELIAELTNPEYYKNPDFSLISSLIDDIIFSDNPLKHTRQK